MSNYLRKNQRAWDIEHLSDDDYASKYSPNGAGIAWPIFIIGVVFAAVTVVAILQASGVL
jgi:hypothetical protein